MSIVQMMERRERALDSYGVIDTGREPAYDTVTEIAALVCEVPVALVSFVQTERQWFKARCGLDLSETPIDQSICAHAITADEYLEVGDTQADERTHGNPLCVGEDAFRFYAGAVVRSADGVPLGTVCVLDRVPRELTPLQRALLPLLARQVESLLELRRPPDAV